MEGAHTVQVTVIDPSIAGISGDMLLGALIDVGADVKKIRDILRLIPQHFSSCKSIDLEIETGSSHGFKACGVHFKILGEQRGIPSSQMLEAAKQIAERAELSKSAVSFALGSIRLLIEVESKIHETNSSETHLHEAGSADTLADTFGVAAACDSLKLFDGTITSTPVAVGGGSVTFSHGTLSVPAPAAMEIIRTHNIPIKGGPEATELVTPTGIALLANLTQSFHPFYPEMIPNKVGYGAGKKQLTSSPNILRVVLGTTTELMTRERVDLLETNLDDVSGEILGHALLRLIDSGARDAWITAAQFKKSRPGHVLHALCAVKDTERLARIMMEETGTLGVRRQQWDRFILGRDFKTMNIEIAGKKFEVRLKIARDKAGNVVRAKPEFEDIASISRALSIPAEKVERRVLVEAERLGIGA